MSSLTAGQIRYRSGAKKASLDKQVGPRLCCICEKLLKHAGNNQKTCTTGIKGVKHDCQKEREFRLRKKYTKDGRRHGEDVKPQGIHKDENLITAWRACIGTKCRGKKMFQSPSKFIRQCDKCKRLAPDVRFHKAGKLIVDSDDIFYREKLHEFREPVS
jgi:hypothetical protein